MMQPLLRTRVNALRIRPGNEPDSSRDIPPTDRDSLRRENAPRGPFLNLRLPKIATSNKQAGGTIADLL
ncbi:hypothetical protein PUN28_018396 [Cardiocondyla obscurior]|uniref:Uncharacterized protein n=1 Tax=Cardiocondyla obscurior TaxID=286306 RepID=A0AAW2EN12_9HYME